MNAPRNVPLIERRADARDLAERIKEHRAGCVECSYSRGGCEGLLEMRAEQRGIREEIAHWFGPGPDQPTLFDGLTFPCCGCCEHDEDYLPHRKPCHNGCNDESA